MSDIEKVKKLREATGAGFKDCNLAIKESGGDLDKAVEILRVKGISKASKKMSRDAKEGVVAVSGDEGKISAIEVNCETDFVAKNDDFINFVKELSEMNNEKNSNLDDLKNISKTMIEEHGTQILKIMENISDTQKIDSGIMRVNEKQKRDVSEAQNEVKIISKNLGVVSELIATKKEIKNFILGEENVRFMHGWRYEIFGKRLLELIN